MTAYLLKTIVCAALFFGFYILILEREKMHRFNRFYLLLAVVIPFCIPFIRLPANANITDAGTAAHFFLEDLQSTVIINEPVVDSPPDHPVSPFLLGYWVVSTFLCYRFIRNLVSIYLKTNKNHVVPYAGAKLVLLESKVPPHSFLQFIFVNRVDYENGLVEKEILSHELAHVKQQHTLDILLLQFILIFAWVNPIIFLLIKAVQLNHEYLADDAVVQGLDDKTDYQLLLINKTRQPDRMLLGSPFNYLFTKKRLRMISRTTTPAMAVLKQAALITLVCSVIFLFSAKTAAQEKSDKNRNDKMDSLIIEKTKPAVAEKKDQKQRRILAWRSPGSTKEGVSEALMKEYEMIDRKYRTSDDPFWWKKVKFSREDEERLEEIYLQMSIDQQSKQHIAFISPEPPLPRKTLTTSQFEAFKNPAIYGVWLDNKKVNNQVLSKYTNTDFSHHSVSKLYGAAKKNVKYFYQVNLLTNDAFEANNKKARENKKNHMVFRGWKE